MSSDAEPVTHTVGGRELLAPALELARDCYGAETEPPEWWAWYLFGLGSATSRIAIARRGTMAVGMQPLTIAPFQLGNAVLKGAVLFAGMVHPSFRRQGLFRTLVSVALEEAWRLGADLAVTMPNARSYPAFVKAGWRDLGERALLAAPAFVPAARHRAGGEYQTSVVEHFGPDAGTFSGESAAADAALTPQRTDQWLRWRFDGNPMGKYVKTECRDAAGDLKGLAAGRIIRRGPMRIGVIVESVSRPGPAACALLAGLSNELRRQGASGVAAVASTPALAAALSAIGLWRIPRRLAPKRFYTVWHPRPGEAEPGRIPSSIAAWHLTLADWDGI